MKRIVVIFCLLLSFGASAQEGIHFDHLSWSELKAKAIKENKLIFVDFYTQWCGPCLAMAQDVFVLGSVGNYFNITFINAKIDAENGEGIDLAKRYGVKSYPTFAFIDPKTEQAVHLSGSRQDKETFLFTAQSALDPQKRSTYLEEQKKLGNSNPEFLLDYASYAASRYNRDVVDNIVEKLALVSGYSLDNERVWNLFVKSVGGRENAYFKEMVKNYSSLSSRYGQKAVDGKLFKEFGYCPNEAEFANVPNFSGKDYLIQKNKADRLIKEKKFKDAALAIDPLMVNPGNFKDELCVYLRFTSRMVWYGVYPDFWVKKCLSYAQYAAYNFSNRNDATNHYEYALQLERMLRSIPDAGKYVPESILKAAERDYNMRPAELKKKPVKK